MHIQELVKKLNQEGFLNEGLLDEDIKACVNLIAEFVGVGVIHRKEKFSTDEKKRIVRGYIKSDDRAEYLLNEEISYRTVLRWRQNLSVAALGKYDKNRAQKVLKLLQQGQKTTAELNKLSGVKVQDTLDRLRRKGLVCRHTHPTTRSLTYIWSLV